MSCETTSTAPPLNVNLGATAMLSRVRKHCVAQRSGENNLAARVQVWQAHPQSLALAFKNRGPAQAQIGRAHV